MNRFESVLLGDNPFFGVDHLSQERARSKEKTSRDLDNALNVIKYSYGLGVRGMVVSTHPTLKDLIQKIATKSDLLEKIEFYPILPYAQGYVLKINEKGMINTLTDILNTANLQDKMKILVKGGLGVARKDLIKLFKVLIDIEILQLRNAKLKVIFLHDVVTDLALSLKMRTIFEVFKEYVEDKYNVEIGLVTKNFPKLVNTLSEWHLEIPYIMTSFNKIGFQMNPSREECELALNKYNGNVIAMSVLAGGYIPLQEAYDYIQSQPRIKKMVIGLSSTEHAESTFRLFTK